MQENPGWPHRGLYAITADRRDSDRLRHEIEAVLAAGVRLLQYRNKSATPALRAEQARMLAQSCRVHGARLIVNDDVTLAFAVAADGVHLGSDDTGVAAARAALGPGAIIGVSCYDSLARARAARNAGASYLAFGACFESTTRPGRPRVTPALFAQARAFGLPLVAIGGLRPDNAGVFVAAGADLIAAIGALFDTPDPATAALRFETLFQDTTA